MGSEEIQYSGFIHYIDWVLILLFYAFFLQGTESWEHQVKWKWEFFTLLSVLFNVVIVLEEEVVMENVGDFTNAFIVLFEERMNEEYKKFK